jgi:hypothetical protein
VLTDRRKRRVPGAVGEIAGKRISGYDCYAVIPDEPFLFIPEQGTVIDSTVHERRQIGLCFLHFPHRTLLFTHTFACILAISPCI